ncbi:MAG: N-acetylmuramate alpha-1-phosphate uridylyltransferase MurU [Methylococcales bacterium]
MILAAGRGERLRPLTDTLPKPLLPVAGKPLIEYTIGSLVASGFQDIVINLAYLGQRIESALGNGSRFNARLVYSNEGECGLEIAGGIVYALPLLGEDPFLVVNGDILTDYPFARLRERVVENSSAFLVMVRNPAHHPAGDFAIQEGRAVASGDKRLTFSGIGLYSPCFFAACPRGKWPLAPLLRDAMQRGRVGGEFYEGFWMDLGTIERYREAEQAIKSGQSALREAIDDERRCARSSPRFR